MDENDDVGLDTQLSKAHSSKRMLEELIEDKNFKHLLELVEAQIKAREHEILVMPGGLDDVIKRIYSSGEVAGMKIVINLPEILIGTLKENIELLNRQIEKQEKEERK